MRTCLCEEPRGNGVSYSEQASTSAQSSVFMQVSHASSVALWHVLTQSADSAESRDPHSTAWAQAWSQVGPQ